MEQRFTLDYEELDDLRRYLKMLLESNELDRYEDGYKMYGQITAWIEQIDKRPRF